MNGSEATFVGRHVEIAALKRMVQDRRLKVLCILGETGVGKTALASHLVDQIPQERFQEDPIRELGFVPNERDPSASWWKGFEDWLVAALAKKTFTVITPKMTRDEVVQGILAAVSKQRTLVLLDNVETLDQNWLREFAGKWLKHGGESLLLLTTTKRLSLRCSQRASYRVYPLHGITEPNAMLTLLGGQMRDQFGKAALLKVARMVRGIPQRLIYLGSSGVQTRKELNRLANLLKRKNSPGVEIADIKRRIKGPLTHFLALGSVRTIEIPESLFTHLWDRLDGGTTEEYISVREQLIAKRFLSRTGKEGTELRIHPSVHIQLEKQLARHIGKAHLSHVDYYLSEYYRDRINSPDSVSDSATVGKYVYHAIRSDNLVSVLEWLLSPKRLRSMHYKGMAIGLHPILVSLDGEVKKQMQKIQRARRGKRTSSKAHAKKSVLRRLWSLLKVEMAHCENDLSKHATCLKHLGEAEAMLDSSPEAHRVRQSINYLRGVSYSDLGQPKRCIDAYYEVVNSQMELGTRSLDERGILSLGYLATECRLTNPAIAESLGREALRLANEHGDSSLIAKSNCSLAHTFFFSGKTEDAVGCAAKAEEMCRDPGISRPDRRELGRVMICRALMEMSKGRYKTTRSMLQDASQINADSGDRRRLASAQALLGTCCWLESKEPGTRPAKRRKLAKQAKALMEQAIEQHLAVEDWRNATWDALAYAHMKYRCANSEKAIEAAGTKRTSQEPWVQALLNPSPDASCELFLQYWDASIRKHLLKA